MGQHSWDEPGYFKTQVFLLRWHIMLQKTHVFHTHSLTLQSGGGEKNPVHYYKEVFLLYSSVDTLCW